MVFYLLKEGTDWCKITPCMEVSIYEFEPESRPVSDGKPETNHRKAIGEMH